VVQIARDMGKHTISEWAPDEETVKVLAGLGVDYGQVFYLGRPAALSEHLAVGEARPTTIRRAMERQAGDRV
jgi:EAL domain-containing protein (putative c-di-GMP-specific phosphodiesterase class I)